MLLLAFLTMLVFGLGALFLTLDVTVLVCGITIHPSNVLQGFFSFAVFNKCLHISGLWIETLKYEHSLVASWRLVGERVNQFRLVKFLTLLEEGWHLSHP